MKRMSTTLKRILYVEDEADIRAVATMALEAVGGFTVVACSSGAEALEASDAADADLILLDVMMPGMDGPSTLEALRANRPTASIPVVFMTAKVQPAEIAHYKSLGAIDVIPKPFDPMSVSAEVQRIWDAAHAAKKAA
jgi:CheY-like chemotaxis protein